MEPRCELLASPPRLPAVCTRIQHAVCRRAEEVKPTGCGPFARSWWNVARSRRGLLLGTARTRLQCGHGLRSSAEVRGAEASAAAGAHVRRVGMRLLCRPSRARVGHRLGAVVARGRAGRVCRGFRCAAVIVARSKRDGFALCRPLLPSRPRAMPTLSGRVALRLRRWRIRFGPLWPPRRLRELWQLRQLRRRRYFRRPQDLIDARCARHLLERQAAIDRRRDLSEAILEGGQRGALLGGRPRRGPSGIALARRPRPTRWGVLHGIFCSFGVRRRMLRH